MKKDWPVFSKKELVIGNLEADIGVCTLWSPRETFAKKYLANLMDKVAVVGNLYSVYGLGILIRNYLSNPTLRYLIVSGTELGKSKVAISSLLSDESLYEKISLKKEHIDRFLLQVKIIFSNPMDIRGKIDEGSFKEALKGGDKLKPIFVSLPEPKNEIFPSSFSGHLIRARTIKEGYHKLLKEIRLFGHITGADSEGHRRQELWQLTMVITGQDPYDFDSIPHPEYDGGYIKEYWEAFWMGDEPEDLSYRYGHIIRHGFGNQIKIIVDALKKKNETFRAIISLWAPYVYGGSVNMEDPPCIVTIHLRLTGGALHQWAYIRTNDMFGGWPLNVAALRYFQAKLLEEVRVSLGKPGIQLGELSITSGSAHVYERDWVKIDSLLSKVRPGKFYPDSKGNFEIRVEKEKIVVRHFSPGGELLQIFYGDKAEKLSKEVSFFISDSQNALYVGRELQKAEILLSTKPPEIA